MADPIMFRTEELHVLRIAMDEYHKYFEWLVETLRKDLRPTNLSKVTDWNDPAALKLLADWNSIEGEARQKIGSSIREQEQYANRQVGLHPNILSIIKRGYLYWRRHQVHRKLEALKRHCVEIEYKQKVDKEMEAADIFKRHHKFHYVTPAPMIRLTDFVKAMQRAEGNPSRAEKACVASKEGV